MRILGVHLKKHILFAIVVMISNLLCHGALAADLNYQDNKNTSQRKTSNLEPPPIKTTINGMDIIQKSNYLSINKHVIYEEDSTYLSPSDGDYENYDLISIINNSIVCYSYEYSTSVGAHPSEGTEHLCKNIASGDRLKITDLFNEEELVKKLLADKKLRRTLAKSSKKLDSVKSLDELNSIITDLSGDDELDEEYDADDNDNKSIYNLACMDDNFTSDSFFSFAVTKLNNDNTVNITVSALGSWSTCHGDTQIINLTNLHPKIKIEQFLTADLKPIEPKQ